MSRVSRLQLHNVQSIADADIAVSEYVALTGASDLGKSAVVRGMYALFTNQRGEWLIRHGEPECAVTVTLDDGHCIEWTKRRARSGSYTIDGAPASLEAVRALLPVAVEVDGDDSFPGIQRQHDSVFLFADSPRRRAQILGEFDGSNLLLAADGSVRRRQREAQQAATAARAEAEGLRAELEGLDWVAGAQDAAGLAQTAIERHSALSARVEALSALVEALAAIEGEIAQVRVLRGRLAVDPDAVARVERALLVVALIEDTGRQAADVTRQLSVLGRMPRTDLNPYALRLDALGAGVAVLVTAAAVEQQLAAAALERARFAAESTHARAALAALAGESCPVCGQVLTAEELLA